jgi:hypothetical protein
LLLVALQLVVRAEAVTVTCARRSLGILRLLLLRRRPVLLLLLSNTKRRLL